MRVSKKIIKIDLVDFWFPDSLEAKQQNSIFLFLKGLIEPHYELRISEDPEFLIYSAYGKRHLEYDKCVKIFITPENRRPNFSECDYAFSYDFIEQGRHFRLPYYRILDSYPLVRGYRNPEIIRAMKHKFCCFIVSNPRAEFRIDFFNELSTYKQVDSGGKHLNNIGYEIPIRWKDKLEFMKPYKFHIAFENTEQPGYTTEKILHAFAADAIPIYWGNPLVDRDFNTKAFINYYDYRNLKDVIQEVIRVDQSPDAYASYLSQPPLLDGTDSEFLTDDSIAQKFREIFETARVQRNIYTRITNRIHYLMEPSLKYINSLKRKCGLLLKTVGKQI